MSKEQEQRSHRFSQLVGLELKANFARHEISQNEVAEKLGHSKSGYSRWLNAKPSMPMEAFLNTCEFIGADPRKVMSVAYSRLLAEMGDASSKYDEPNEDLRERALHITDLGLAAKRGDIDGEQEAYEEMP